MGRADGVAKRQNTHQKGLEQLQDPPDQTLFPTVNQILNQALLHIDVLDEGSTAPLVM